MALNKRAPHVLLAGLVLTGCTVQTSSVCNRADQSCAKVALEAPARALGRRAVSFSGACVVDGSDVSIDVQADGASTPGVSSDPIACRCAGERIECPAVTLDMALIGSDVLSFRTTLVNRLGQTATEVQTNVTQLVDVNLNLPAATLENGTLTPTGTCAPSGVPVVVGAPAGFSPSSVSCACLANVLGSCGTFSEGGAPLNQPLEFTASITSGDLTGLFSGRTRVVNSPPVPQSVGAVAPQGHFAGATLFVDPNGDALVYTARLVDAAGLELAAPASQLSTIGLAIHSGTGVISGSLGGYSGQKIIVSAVDPAGSNTRVDSILVQIVP